MRRAAFLLLVGVCVALPCSAQATRTWVSGVGDDANPCSRTAPCKTFAGAMSKTAAGGEINVMDPGGFGAVSINKSLTIDGGGFPAGILATLGTQGITVNAGAADIVTLRNLNINGSGSGANGIRFLAGKALHVENVVIYGFAQKGISFEPLGASTLTVVDSVIRNNQNAANGGGILVKPGVGGTAQVFLERVQLVANHFGVRAEDRTTITASDCSVTGNTSNGLLAYSAGGLVDFSIEGSVASGNGNSGVRAMGAGARVRISNVMSTNNGVGLSADSGGTITSFGTNRLIANGVDGAPTTTIPQQ